MCRIRKTTLLLRFRNTLRVTVASSRASEASLTTSKDAIFGGDAEVNGASVVVGGDLTIGAAVTHIGYGASITAAGTARIGAYQAFSCQSCVFAAEDTIVKGDVNGGAQGYLTLSSASLAVGGNVTVMQV